MVINKISVLLSICLSVILFTSCTNDSLDDLTPSGTNNNTSGTITYNANVKSILSQQCVSCHGSVNPSGNLNISTYTTAKNNINKIISRIDLQTGQSGIMPPSGRMAENNIQVIKDWKTQGLLEQ